MSKRDKESKWWERSWNPVHGCTKISPGCKHCYAEIRAFQLAQNEAVKDYEIENPFAVKLCPLKVDEPRHWKKPRIVFVPSMGDLFHSDVPDTFIHQVYDAMKFAVNSIFIVVTKRPDRIVSALYKSGYLQYGDAIENVWHITSCENQEYAEKRIPELLDLRILGSPQWPVLGISFEPLLGDIQFFRNGSQRISGFKDTSEMSQASDNLGCLDWFIIGGESGESARIMDPHWVRSLIVQANEFGIPVYFKQWGEWIAKSQIQFLEPHALDGIVKIDNMPTFEAKGIMPETFYRITKSRAGHTIDGKKFLNYPINFQNHPLFGRENGS